MNTTYEKFPVGWLRISSHEGKIVNVDYVDEAYENDERDKVLEECVKELHEYFDGRRTVFNIEIDFDYYGTAFQREVWRHLYNIPYGATISYKTLAEKCGGENYSRAVANANGKNPISIIVPCHRVIASDGGMGGYTGGLDKKEYLLRHEHIILV